MAFSQWAKSRCRRKRDCSKRAWMRSMSALRPRSSSNVDLYLDLACKVSTEIRNPKRVRYLETLDCCKQLVAHAARRCWGCGDAEMRQSDPLVQPCSFVAPAYYTECAFVLHTNSTYTCCMCSVLNARSRWTESDIKPLTVLYTAAGSIHLPNSTQVGHHVLTIFPT